MIKNDLNLLYIVISQPFLLPSWHKRQINIQIIHLTLNTQGSNTAILVVLQHSNNVKNLSVNGHECVPRVFK